jgi:hypothetical protein
LPIESVSNTNNHLETYNNQLKTHRLNRFQNGGHLLRLDVLSVLLIKSITPNLLLCINLKKRLDEVLNTRFIQYTSKSRKPDQSLQKLKQITQINYIIKKLKLLYKKNK